MSRHYRHPGGRIQHRNSSGRFRHSTLADIGIHNAADRDRTCVCGHTWRPIVTTGLCPKCGEQNSKPAALTAEEKAKLAEYRAIPTSIDPRDTDTLNQAQRLYEWLNARGVFSYLKHCQEVG